MPGARSGGARSRRRCVGFYSQGFPVVAGRVRHAYFGLPDDVDVYVLYQDDRQGRDMFGVNFSGGFEHDLFCGGHLRWRYQREVEGLDLRERWRVFDDFRPVAVPRAIA
eukprot:9544236-Alexandrium_andersonii.AAC.1